MNNDFHPPQIFHFIVHTPASRLDTWLTHQIKECGDCLSRTQVQKAIRTGGVLCNGSPLTDPSAPLLEGDQISLTCQAPTPLGLIPESRELDIVYEDNCLLVLNKPPGLVVHPAPGHHQGTLVHALLAHCGSSLSGIGGIQRPGIVHRLDKDTSGLIVVAKTNQAHHNLSAQFADHGRTGHLQRIYHGLVWGVPTPIQGTIERPIGRHSHNREKMATVPHGRGRWAITHYKTFETFSPSHDSQLKQRKSLSSWHVSLLHFRLETGRTHQIRVHCSAIGHPLLGDPTYGSHFSTKDQTLPEGIREALHRLSRPALHAAVLGFSHPETGAILRFERPPPEDFSTLLQALSHGE
jgi:23S rRNA pseudouridine1911/1915/1917 synthase